MGRKRREDLRSARWFASDDFRSFGHRSRAMQMGLAPKDWEDKPVIAILNTWSEANPCHLHFKQRVEDVKRGVLQALGNWRHTDARARRHGDRAVGRHVNRRVDELVSQVSGLRFYR